MEQRKLMYCPECGYIGEHHLTDKKEYVCPSGGVVGAGIPIEKAGEFKDFCPYCLKTTLHSKLKILVPENKKTFIKNPGNVLFCESCKRAISQEYKRAAEECNYRCAECRSSGKESVDKEVLETYSKFCSKEPKELQLYREKDEKYVLLCDNCFKKKYEQRKQALKKANQRRLFKQLPIKNIFARIFFGILIGSFGAFALAIPGIVLFISAGTMFKLLGMIMLVFGSIIFVYGMEMTSAK